MLGDFYCPAFSTHPPWCRSLEHFFQKAEEHKRMEYNVALPHRVLPFVINQFGALGPVLQEQLQSFHSKVKGSIDSNSWSIRYFSDYAYQSISCTFWKSYASYFLNYVSGQVLHLFNLTTIHLYIYVYIYVTVIHRGCDSIKTVL